MTSAVQALSRRSAVGARRHFASTARLVLAVLVVAFGMPLAIGQSSIVYADPAAGPGAIPTPAAAAAIASGTIPDGTCRAKVTATGAGGGGGATSLGGLGGAGAVIGATFDVLPGQAYGGSVGGGGGVINPNNNVVGVAGFGGGGTGGTAVTQHAGAGGGGRTVITLAGQTVAIAGAGGGGGAAHQASPLGDGGNGGTAIGAGVVGPGFVGQLGQERVGPPPTGATVGGGQGGQPTLGGAGGVNSGSGTLTGGTGGDATTGVGGNGGPDANYDAGGGGGAGYTGGGGGAATIDNTNTGGGGGGGSSWIVAASPVVAATAPSAITGTQGAKTASNKDGAAGAASIDWLPCLYNLSLTKTAAPATVKAGDKVTWTITVTNNGPDPMTKGDTVGLTDTLPGPTAATPAPTYKVVSITTAGGTNTNLTRGVITCSGVAVGSSMPTATNCSRPYAAVAGTPGAPAAAGSRGLDPGESITIVYEQVISNTAPCANITNTATVKDRPTQTVSATDVVGNIVTDTVNTPIAVQCYDLAITKTASPKPVLRGANITWTISVTNSGPADMVGPVATVANPLTIADTFPTAGVTAPTLASSVGPAGACTFASPTITCPSSLKSGETQVLTFTQPVTATATFSSTISNTATVTDFKTPTTNNTATDSTTVATVGLLVTKTSPTQSFAAVGDVINYTITVTNSGQTAASNVTVTDPGAVLSACTPALPVASLASGATISCPATRTVVAADLAGSYTNTATANGTAPVGATGSGSVTTPVAKLALTKTTPALTFAAVGDVVSYTITATNTGTATLTNAGITDPNAVLAACTPVLPVASLAPAATISCPATHTVTQADLDAGTLVNTATATATRPGGATLTVNGSATTPATQSPALTVTKTSSTQSFSAVGNVINYTVTVKNTGNVTVTGVGVTDPGAVLAACTPAIPVASLAPNATISCPASHTVVAADLAGAYTNTATATATKPGGGNVSASGSVITPVAKLSVTKTSATASFSAVGDVISYTITTTNTGTSALTNVGVTDPNAVLGTCTPALPVASLAAGASISCAATHTVVAGDLAGSFTNTATASGTSAAGATVSASGSVTTPVAKLSVSKTSPTASFAAVGDVISYAITVTNSGTSALTNVGVTDPNAVLGTCTPALPVASLAAGGTISCAATHTVVAGDLAGSFTNTATASGTSAAGATVSASGAVTTPVARLAVSKTSPTANYNVVGATISYTITVTNTGTATLTGVGVTDPNAVLSACTPVIPVASLIAGATISCPATHTVTQADLDGGSVVNTASATGTKSGGGTVTASGLVTTPAVQSPALSVTKTSPTVNYSVVGATISYTITVKNTGNVTLTGVGVSDPNAVLSACTPVVPVASLAVNATISCPATHAVTQADLDAGSVVNTATATGTAPGGATVSGAGSVTTPAVQSPALSVTKTSPTANYSAVGATISYTITVKNTSNVTLTGVGVSDPNAVLSACTPVIPVASLAVNATISCPATHTVTQADLDAGSYSNTATATATAPGGATVSASGSVTTPAVRTPALSVTKSGSPATVSAVGDVISYTITVKNTGNVTLTAVGVTDPNAVLAACTPVLPVASLAPNATISCPATHTATQSDLDAGSVVNTAAATGTAPGGASTTASGVATTPAVQSPALTVTKTSSTANYSAVGDVISYTITVKNTGNVTLTAVGVTDPNAVLAACTPVLPVASLAPNATISCPATHTATQADLDAGSVLNTATATGTKPGGGTATASGSVSVPAVQSPALTVTKTSPTANYSVVGATISYTVTVKNSGNVTLSNVGVTDANAVLAACTPVLPAASLAPNATVSCPATHVVVQADLDAGAYLNTATAAGTAPGGASVSASGSVSVPAVQSPALTVTKTSSTANYTTVGATISYTVTVTNSGNVSLANVGVADPNAVLGACTPVVPVASLAPNATISCPATHTATPADLDAGSVLNTATATGTKPGGGTATASGSVSVPAVQSPALTVTKTSPTANYSVVGATISYTVTVKNSGNVTLSNVGVTDANAVLAACTPVLPAASLAPNATVSCPATHVVVQADLDAGTYLNTATAAGTAPGGASVSASGSVSVPAVQSPSLTVTKTSPTTNFNAIGQTINYSILVTNTGNVTLNTVAVSDPNADTLSCAPTTLAPTAVTTCAATHIVTQTDLDNNNVTNTAHATAVAPVAVAVSGDSSPVVVPAVQAPALLTTKASSTVNYSVVGATINYTVTVTNTGNVTVHNLVVTDPVASAISCSPAILAPGQVANCVASHIVTQSDLDLGHVDNVATAAALSPTNAAVSDPSDLVTVPAVQTPVLTTTKSTTTANFNAVGNVVNYTITIKNDGNVTVHGLVLSDPVADAGSISCAPATLAPGASASCTATHTVVQADLDLGRVDNTATAAGLDPANNPVSDASNTVSVPTVQTSKLTVTKTTSTSGFNAAGQIIAYSITATNTGNVTLTSVSVTDANAVLGACTPALPVATLAPNSTISCAATHTVVQADVDAGFVDNTAAVAGTSPANASVTAQSAVVHVVAAQGPALTLTKTTPTLNYGTAGQTINYTITATNAGNVTLSNVSITDPNATIGTCTPVLPVASLVVNATISCTASHLVTQADVDAGSIVNTANASATAPGPVVLNVSATATTPASQTPSLTTVKSTTSTDYNTVGQSIPFTIVVTNTGNVTLTGVTVTDANAALGLCTPATPVSLLPGASISCAATHAVTQNDLDLGTVTNTASASGRDPSNNQVSAPSAPVTVNASQAPALIVTKSTTTSNFNTVGQSIAYTVTATNSGNVTLTNVSVTDANATLGACTPSVPVGSLAVGDAISCAATHAVTQADLDAGSVVNVASAAGTAPGNVAVSKDSAPVTVNAVQAPKLSVAKSTTSTGYATVGQTITYTVSVVNSGNVTLSNVSVADANATLGTCTPSVPVGSLAVGGSISCAATHTVTQADLDAGSVVNIASAAGTAPGNVAVSKDSAPVTVNATQAPALTVTKSTTTPNFNAVGQTIAYTVAATNSGNVTLANVAVTDANASLGTCTPSVPVATLAVGGSISCAATHTVTQADLDAGSVVNVASAAGTAPGNVAVSKDSAPVTVNALQAPALSVAKSTTSTGYATVGQTIAYTVAATNSGNVTLANLSVTDANATLGTCTPSVPVTTLAVGGSISCAATHIVTQADLDTGSVVNIASAAGTAPGNVAVSKDSAPVTVNALQTPALSVAKSTAATNFNTVGQTISYTVTATNSGNVTLANVSVTDANATLGTCTPSVPVATLAVGSSISCAATHTVTQADLDGGSVVNVASAAGTAPGNVAVSKDSAAVTTPAVLSPKLIVGKSTTTTNFNIVGQTITYAVTATNSGNVTLSNVSVTDANATLGVCTPTVPATSLAVGASISCAATHIVTQADLDAGFVDNTAATAGTDPTNTAVTAQSGVVRVPAVQAPKLLVSKTTPASSYATVGETINYSITVTNNGNVTLSGVGVTDPNATVGTCTPTTPVVALAVSATMSCSASHIVTQADLDAGSIVNTATADGTDPTNAAVSALATATTPAAQVPALTTVKSTTSTGYATIGQSIPFTIAVTNTGNVTLTAVTVTDANATLGACAPVSLAPGASITCSATHIATQADLDFGSVANTAAASGLDPLNNQVSSLSTPVVVPAAQSPALTTAKSTTSTGYATVGQSIPFTIVVTNSGNVTLTSVTVADGNATLGTCTPAIPVSSLAVGASITCSATHVVTQADLNAGSVVNTATAAGLDPTAAPVSKTSAPVTVAATQTPALTTVKTTSSTGYATVGDSIAYSIVVTNTGNVTVTGVTVTDTNATLGTCAPVTLAPGASLACSATHAVTQADLDGGTVVNTAAASGLDPKNNQVSDPSDPVTVSASQTAKLTTVKTTTSTGFTAVGDSIAYSIVVSNSGNVTVNGVAVVDANAALGACAPLTLAPGASLTCSATHVVTQADLDGGSVINTATASGTDPKGATVPSTSGPVTVSGTQTATLTTVKSTTSTGFSAVGDSISYSIVATNSGNVSLTNVTVTDANATLGACTPVAPASLAVGASLTCPATHVVTQADLDAGFVPNTATADGLDPANKPVSGPSNAVTVNGTQSPALTTVKTTSSTGYTAVGQTISYSIVVTNSGNVTVSGVTIVDANATLGTCAPATLTPGASLTCSATHIVTQADLDNGSVVNTATSSGTDPKGATVPSTSTPVTTNGTQTPTLTTVKTTSSTGYSATGDVINFSITTTNSGNVTLTNVMIADTNATLGTCAPLTLIPGASLTCSATHVVTQADLNAGSVVNTATASGTDPKGAAVPSTSTPVTVIGTQGPALTTVKTTTSTGYAAVGDSIAYSIVVTNTGNVTVTAVTVTDANATLGVCAPVTLAPAASLTCSATHIVTQADLDAGTVVNTASASGLDPSNNQVSDPSSPVTVNGTQTVQLTTVKTTTSTGYAAVGDSIPFTVVVTNTGNVTVSGVTVVDGNATLGACVPLTLAPGASISCSATHIVTQADVDNGSIVNTATASGLDPKGVTVPSTSGPVTVNGTQTAALTTVKTTTSTGFAAVGDSIAYSIVVTNSGNVTVSAVTVVDGNATLGTCAPGSLAPGASSTCSATHVVTQADLDNGSVVNTATASGLDPKGVTVPSTSGPVTVTGSQTAALTTVKTTSSTSFNAVGQIIAYSIVVTNAGNVTVNSVTVVDANATLGTCAPVTLAPGATLTCSASHVITLADLNAGSVVNTATASGTDPKGVNAPSTSGPVTVNGAQTAALTTVKTTTSTGYAAVGDSIDYSIVVTNSGNVTVSAVTVADPNATLGTCAPVSLAPGASLMCSATHVVTQADLNAGSVINTATASGTDPKGVTVPSTSGPVTVTGTQTAKLTTVKTAISTGYVAVGDSIAYSIVVTNSGNVTVSNATVVDANATLGTCAPVSLAPGASLTCSATHIVTQADLNAGSVINTATASGTDPKGATVPSTSGPVTVTGTQVPALTTVKSTISTGYAAVGDSIAYSIVVTNTGNVTVTAVTVTDGNATLGTCAPAALAPGASLTCSATHAVTLADLNAGNVVNTASASGLDPSNNQVSDPSDPVTVIGTQTATLTTVKTTTSTGFNAVGQTIAYSIVVTNTGNVTVNSVTVVDANATLGICAPVSLAPAASITCTATHIVTLTDLNNGSIVNTATASGTDPKGATVPSTSGPVTVNGAQTAALTTVKTTTSTGYAAVGDSIGYSIVVTNSGNVTVNAVTVVDANATLGTCAPVALAPGASITCTAAHTVTQADLNAGSVINTATASGTDPKGATVPSTSGPVTVTGTQTATLTAVKSSISTGFAAVGDVLNYSVVVTNTGNVTINALLLSDAVADAGSISCDVNVLAPTEVATCTAAHTVTQADLDLGKVDNTATATGKDPLNNTVSTPSNTVSVPATQTALLSLNKTTTATSFNIVGQTIPYTLTVGNSGNVTLTNVVVSDLIADAGSITCTPAAPVASLAPGATVSCTATHTTKQSDLDAGSVVNVAKVTGADPKNNPVSKDSQQVTVLAAQAPGLATTKSTTSTGFSAVGQTVNYSIAVLNSGNATITAISVSDPVADGGVVTCDVTALAPGATANCAATHTVTQADLDNGKVVNTATAAGLDPANKPVSAPSNTVTVPATQTALLTATKSTTSTGFNAVGQKISYTIAVSNDGNVTIHGLAVGDPIADIGSITCDVTVLAPGATANCTATHTVTQANVDTGKVVNTATASGLTPTNTSVSDASNTVTVLAAQSSGLTVLKSSTTASFNAVGQAINYSITVTNNGNVTINNLVVTDPIADTGTITCSATVLAPVAVANCTATHTTTQVDLDNGQVSNIAKATGTDPAAAPVSASSNQVIVPATQAQGVSLVKTADITAFDKVGATINYTFVVTNIGTVTLTGVVVADPLAGLSAVDCGTFSGTLAPTGTVTCTASYLTTAADLAAGRVANTATVGGEKPGGNLTDPADDVTAVGSANVPAIGLAVTKTASTSAVIASGEAVTFTVRIDNVGSLALTLDTLTDNVYGNLAGRGSCVVPQTIPTGGSYTCAFAATVSGAAGGTHTNVISAAARTAAGVATSAQGSANVALGNATISGSTWFDANGNGVRDSGEPVQPGVAVQLARIVGGVPTVVATTTTNGIGDYSFAGLPAGNYQVVVGNTLGGFTTANAGSNDTVDSDVDALGTSAVLTVTAGATLTNIDAGLVGTGVVSGVVFADADVNATLNAGDSGLGGIPLTATWGGIDGNPETAADNVTFTTTTASDGSYSFTGLPAGSITVTVASAAVPAGLLITTGGMSTAFTLATAETKREVNFGFGNMQPPVAVNDAATTPANAPIVINVIGNDSSPGGVLDPATVTVIGSPTHGTTSIDPVTGAITYTPAPGFTGIDTLTYRVCEVGGTGGCVTAQVTITVANLPPVVPGGGPTTPINLTTTVGDVPPRLNITDPDGHPASITQLVSGSYPPGLTLNTDGTWSGSATVAGAYSFTVRVCDTGTPQACFDQQITVVVSPVVPPVVPPTTRRLPNSGANTLPMLGIAGGLMIVGLVLRRRSRRTAA